ncbi:MAG: hypothetical protein ACOC3W_00150 [Thermodesulfobacteriota bacterium]
MKAKDRETRETKSTVEGILAASDWDAAGNIIEIKMLATDEEEYRVENRDAFMNLLQKYIRASGTIHPDRNGVQTIHIRKCTVLETGFEDDTAILNLT